MEQDKKTRTVTIEIDPSIIERIEATGITPEDIYDFGLAFFLLNTTDPETQEHERAWLVMFKAVENMNARMREEIIKRVIIPKPRK